MDIATISGLLLSIALIIGAIFVGGAPLLFADPASALIVVGGTIGAVLTKFPLPTVTSAFGVAGKAFSVKLPAPDGLIGEITDLSRKARKEGMLALESIEFPYAYLGKGVGLCVDGVELEEIRSIMEADMRFTAHRHKTGAQIFEAVGQAAPAFGMIGTLIGLVQMLAQMDDPAAIGPAMAVALLTTLYGAFIANVIAIPMADKLKFRSREELLAMSLVLEGVMGLSRGDNPNAIDQKLKAFIAPKLRETEPEKKAEKQEAA